MSKSFYAPLDKCANCWIGAINLDNPNVICNHAVCNECFNILSDHLRYHIFNPRDLQIIFELERDLSLYERTPEMIKSVQDELKRLKNKINDSMVRSLRR